MERNSSISFQLARLFKFSAREFTIIDLIVEKHALNCKKKLLIGTPRWNILSFQLGAVHVTVALSMDGYSQFAFKASTYFGV